METISELISLIESKQKDGKRITIAEILSKAKEIESKDLHHVKFLVGVYSPDEDLIAVHKTEKGAKATKDLYKKQHGSGFFIDKVIVYD